MKKLPVILVALLLVTALAGCSSPAPASNDSGTNHTGETGRAYVDIDAAKVEELIQTDRDLVVIDASGKWAEGHIFGALDTPIDRLQEIINDDFLLDASKHYVVYARDEETSKKAAQMLIDSAFTVVNRLKGGYDAWVAYGGYTEQ